VAELEIGLNAVAVPIRAVGGGVAAALNVSGPAYRLGESDLPRVAEALVAAAATISTTLGYL
jgi:DNA-binding IclR family transcriptional regulator